MSPALHTTPRAIFRSDRRRSLPKLIVSPNLVLDNTAQHPGGVASANTRGIGASEVEMNFDPAVGVILTGTYDDQGDGFHTTRLADNELRTADP